MKTDPNEFISNSKEKLITKSITGKVLVDRMIFFYGKPVVHTSVLLRKLNRQNEESPAYAPWLQKLDFDTEIWPEEIRMIKHLS